MYPEFTGIFINIAYFCIHIMDNSNKNASIRLNQLGVNELVISANRSNHKDADKAFYENA